MIWAVVSKEEMESFGTNPVFRFYREAIGKDNIRLAVVDEKDELAFVQSDDIVLLRTANVHLLDTIRNNSIRSTAESYWSYEQVKDKEILAKFLKVYGIRVPRQFFIGDVEDGKTYFVKPRCGSDSKGISLMSICRSKDEVQNRIEYIRENLEQEAVIEEFIDGVDCIVACVGRYDSVYAYAIEVECDETNGIQTRDCKVGFKECCSALRDEEIKRIARDVFHRLGLMHHARIDFRRDREGNYYVIDVNLLPGLGPLDHFAKCMLLSDNISYRDAIMSIINSATT